MEKGYYSILRVSHLSQIDNFSIEQQKESIQTYATLHSIEITEHLAECGSGTTGERKQIQTLYRLISEDRVEGILCYKLDRIFRNMKLSIDFISICVEKGIKIHSVAENISTDTPAGMFMVNCLLSVNQYAVDNIRGLVKGGTDHDGSFKWNHAPVDLLLRLPRLLPAVHSRHRGDWIAPAPGRGRHAGDSAENGPCPLVELRRNRWR